MPIRDSIDNAVATERVRQEIKWGKDGTCANPDMSNLLRLAVLTEEVGEVANEVLEGRYEPRSLQLRAELVQVAAVAKAWIEGLDAVSERGLP